MFKHDTVKSLAEWSDEPVINALCDLEHPCQAVADMTTVLEYKGRLDNSLTMTFVGDGNNNITHSLALACARLGVNFNCASPPQHAMDPSVVAMAQDFATETGAVIGEYTDAKAACNGVDIIYADTFVSMGQEHLKAEKVQEFAGFQVTSDLMACAADDAIFMHDMPAYRGIEVTEEVIDGPQSVIIHQASNRLHGQKAVILFLKGVEV